MNKLSKVIVAALVGISLTLSAAAPASALEIKNRRIAMVAGHGSQSVYTCYYDYNWFEELVLGYRDGPRSGTACR